MPCVEGGAGEEVRGLAVFRTPFLRGELLGGHLEERVCGDLAWWCRAGRDVAVQAPIQKINKNISARDTPQGLMDF